MKLSTKTRYAMRFMVFLARNYGQGPIPMKEIAQSEGISKKYLEQVVSPLTSAGLLSVKRGQAGGFTLSRDPKEISLADVMSVSEDGLELIDCLAGFSACDNQDRCISKSIWGGLRDVILDYLNNKSLADVIEETSQGCPEIKLPEIKLS